jgi:hypothetical protein
VSEAASRAVVVTLALALAVGACSSSKHANGTATSVPSAASSTAATTSSTVPSTIPQPAATDPFPGTVMLGIHDRTIDALDAQGHKLKTLVTVFAGRQVENARLLADHETIWYSTTQGAPPYCDEVVRLDLRTNARVVEAYANDFTVSADGARLLLVSPKPYSDTATSCPETPAIKVSGHDAIAVRDLRTGAQSAVDVNAYPTAGSGGPYGHVWMSPSGDQLVDSSCTNDPCAMRSITVPAPLGAPLVVHDFGSGPQCGCGTLVTGRDGVYGVDVGSLDHPQTLLRRYDSAHLAGRGTVLVSPAGVTLSSVAPTSAGVYVLGRSHSSTTGYVYRFRAGALEQLAPGYREIFAVPTFVAS